MKGYFRKRGTKWSFSIMLGTAQRLESATITLKLSFKLLRGGNEQCKKVAFVY